MQYKNTVHGTFQDRPNRFVAHVWIEGALETVHVKNTGRCRELLLPGANVVLQRSDNSNRKTKYDLISVYKEHLGWVNIDSQATNQVVLEWLRQQDFEVIRPEYSFGKSRLDFYLEKAGEKYLLEVKGCTLEMDGVGYFPDAKSERASRHALELKRAVQQGYHCAIVYVIAMEGVTEVRPNVERDPAFAAAQREAIESGVEIWHLGCKVTENSLKIVMKNGKEV